MFSGQMERTDVTLLLSRGARLEGVALCPPGGVVKEVRCQHVQGSPPAVTCTSPWHFQVISTDVVK